MLFAIFDLLTFIICGVGHFTAGASNGKFLVPRNGHWNGVTGGNTTSLLAELIFIRSIQNNSKSVIRRCTCTRDTGRDGIVTCSIFLVERFRPSHARAAKHEHGSHGERAEGVKKMTFAENCPIPIDQIANRALCKHTKLL
ncbi:hypothetical protein [Mailhella sp.]|uniref:hypothetical protein n=1 Tax=Mailhella sp. TaxID=1981029 RepID=UPI004063D686